MKYTQEQVADAIAWTESDGDNRELQSRILKTGRWVDVNTICAEILAARVRELEAGEIHTGFTAEIARICQRRACRLEREVIELREVLRGMLDDYRSEGCPAPDCEVCRRSKAAEDAAHEALSRPSAVNEDVAAMLRGSLRKREDDPAPPMPEFPWRGKTPEEQAALDEANGLTKGGAE